MAQFPFAYFQTGADDAIAMPVKDIDGIHINAATEITITATVDLVQLKAEQGQL